MKKALLLFIVCICIVVFQSLVESPKYSTTPPTGYTGASGDYCASCHSSFAVNSGGGSVSITGLPSGTYVAGQQYNFSLTISHSVADRSIWGFSIKAVNSAGQSVGTFSSSNSNASNNGTELSHNGAVTTSPSSSYTYSDLKWTAPATPSVSDKNVTFYYVANAANNNAGSNGDYIYAGSTAITLPAQLNNFNATVVNKSIIINWQTSDQKNVSYFEVEKSDNAQTFYPIAKVGAIQDGASNNYSYTDNSPSYFNKPISYRLKIVDKDGSYKHSSVVSTKIKMSENFVSKIYPTLITKGTTITAEVFSNSKKEINLQLVDINGKQLQQFRFMLNEGVNTISFQPKTSFTNNWVFAKFTSADFNQTLSLFAH